MAWKRFKQRAACAAGECKDHTPLCLAWIEDAGARRLPGAFTCECSCTSATVLNHMQSQQRAEVGDLKLTRHVVYDGWEQSLQAVARQLPWGAKQPVRMGQRRYGYFRQQRRIPDVDHPGRVVVFWQARGDQEASTALVSNRLGWEVIRMVVVYRYRWTGTETFPRDGKQRLGLGDCQGRTGEGQARHVYLVSVASSLLRRSLHQTHLYDWARRTLTTIGEACRAVKAETLERIVDGIVDKLTVAHWSIPEMKAVLAQHEAGSTLQNFSYS